MRREGSHIRSMEKHKEATENNDPACKDQADAKKEQAAATSTKTGKTKQNPTGHEGKSNEANKQPGPIGAFLLRIWMFIKDPKHSNALVAIFTVVITIDRKSTRLNSSHLGISDA